MGEIGRSTFPSSSLNSTLFSLIHFSKTDSLFDCIRWFVTSILSPFSNFVDPDMLGISEQV